MWKCLVQIARVGSARLHLLIFYFCTHYIDINLILKAGKESYLSWSRRSLPSELWAPSKDMLSTVYERITRGRQEYRRCRIPLNHLIRPDGKNVPVTGHLSWGYHPKTWRAIFSCLLYWRVGGTDRIPVASADILNTSTMQVHKASVLIRAKDSYRLGVAASAIGLLTDSLKSQGPSLVQDAFSNWKDVFGNHMNSHLLWGGPSLKVVSNLILTSPCEVNITMTL